MSEYAAKKKLNFLLELENDELNIKVDWSKFEMIIYSLVDNALIGYGGWQYIQDYLIRKPK